MREETDILESICGLHRHQNAAQIVRSKSYHFVSLCRSHDLFSQSIVAIHSSKLKHLFILFWLPNKSESGYIFDRRFTF
jgi:hypothetical protein